MAKRLDQFISSAKALDSLLTEAPSNKKMSGDLRSRIQKVGKEVIAHATLSRLDSPSATDGHYQELATLYASITKRYNAIAAGGGFKWLCFNDTATKRTAKRALDELTKTFAPIAQKKCEEVLKIQAENERELSFLSKVNILNRLFDDPDDKFANELIASSTLHDHLKDLDFARHLIKLYAKSYPETLIKNLAIWPKGILDSAPEAAALLQEPAHREAFCKHFQLDLEKVEALHKVYQNTEPKLDQQLMGHPGICNGYTLTFLSSHCPKTAAEVSSRARFVMAGYILTMLEPNFSPHNLIAIGSYFLKNKKQFKPFFSEALDILGKEGAKNPYLIGRMVIKKHSPQKLQEAFEFKLAALKQEIEEIRKEDENAPELVDGAAQVKSIESILNALKPLKNFQNKVPELVMSKLGVTEQDLLFKEYQPLSKIDKLLMGVQERLGKFKLNLSPTKAGDGGHTMMLCFSPPTFVDPNDIDPVTAEPIVRTFSTAKEMLEKLRTYLCFTYIGKENRRPFFNLVPTSTS
ncbi:MAG: hypothetical protein HYX48_07070 [Chlamydiales bacterium]|nr:hypothetical protein [Chlamydiales bacterium]